jgi:hypothetical protein
VRPGAEADAPWRAWALSEVSVRVGRITGEDASDLSIAAAVEATKGRWPEAERFVPLIALQEEHGAWQGRGRNSTGKTAQIRYSFNKGLSFE